MTETLSASCHCGAIHLTVPAAAAGVLACHCADCQKMHGNFNAFLAAPIADITLTGADALVWYQSSAENRRAFCRTCGSRVLKEVTPAGRWLISAGTDRRASASSRTSGRSRNPIGTICPPHCSNTVPLSPHRPATPRTDAEAREAAHPFKRNSPCPVASTSIPKSAS